MANERMYLRCKGCGKALFMGKYYPTTGWYRPWPAKMKEDPKQPHSRFMHTEPHASLEELYADFLSHSGDMHSCHLNFNDGQCFEIVYEAEMFKGTPPEHGAEQGDE